jgi:hypothetical protein
MTPPQRNLDLREGTDDPDQQPELPAWCGVFGDRVIATAILDRVVHHTVTVNILGTSYRLKNRLKAGCKARPQWACTSQRQRQAARSRPAQQEAPSERAFACSDAASVVHPAAARGH